MYSMVLPSSVDWSIRTNLLECYSYNDWTLYSQDKKQVIITYIDFSKAFDVVSHNKYVIAVMRY